LSMPTGHKMKKTAALPCLQIDGAQQPQRLFLV
jgi:hypothetical protein